MASGGLLANKSLEDKIGASVHDCANKLNSTTSILLAVLCPCQYTQASIRCFIKCVSLFVCSSLLHECTLYCQLNLNASTTKYQFFLLFLLKEKHKFRYLFNFPHLSCISVYIISPCMSRHVHVMSGAV